MKHFPRTLCHRVVRSSSSLTASFLSFNCDPSEKQRRARRPGLHGLVGVARRSQKRRHEDHYQGDLPPTFNITAIMLGLVLGIFIEHLPSPCFLRFHVWWTDPSQLCLLGHDAATLSR